MNNKKTILLLSDDIRMHSGVATMSRKIVEGTVKKYNWIQLGAAINNLDEGKILDVSDHVKKNTGVEDASVLIYPSSGYGNQDKIRYLLKMHKIDAILHYTDPRFWNWLYAMEYEIRKKVPLLYYHVWDNLPEPKYNIPFYKSCDLIMNISRQTHHIVKTLIQDSNDIDKTNKYISNKVNICYIPHGIDPKEFKPLTQDEPGEMIEYSDKNNDNNIISEFEAMQQLKKTLFGNDNEFEFIIFYNSRNIHRKKPSDLIYAYKLFMDSLSKEERKKVVLLLHTVPIDNNGTDLYALIDDLCPDYPIYFSSNRLDTKYMNMLYNISSITFSVSNAEGFGLSTAESIMSGTPIAATVTGGLQDQMNFVDEKTGKEIENWVSNHDKKYGNNHGTWANPIFPIQTLTGSTVTPYIYNDEISIEQILNEIKKIYNKRDKLKEEGLKGREWMINGKMNSEWMSEAFIKNIDLAINNFNSSEKIILTKF